ncbi:SseB family protein [Dactylosporangium sp. NPDC051541]|uniref:SseB family protein n=1 Tax=Dactylosporangium sp. NPDC051541 TaxID=3363977 RepID=UPI00378A15F5
MAAAVAGRDQLAYLQALAEEALYVPISPGVATGREPVRLATYPAGGVTYVLAWTSGSVLPPEITHVRRTPLFELVHTIAPLGWGITVNPGRPLQADLSPDAIRTLVPWEPEWYPLDDRLRQAVRAENREAYLAALLEAHLLLPLPTEEELTPEADPDAHEPGDYWTAVRTDRIVPSVSRDVTDPEFPWWRTERVDGHQVIFAFTSVAQLQSEVGDREWIAVPFVDIVVSWPEDGGALRLNPGGSNGMELPPEALREMYEIFLAAMREKNRPRED